MKRRVTLRAAAVIVPVVTTYYVARNLGKLLKMIDRATRTLEVAANHPRWTDPINVAFTSLVDLLTTDRWNYSFPDVKWPTPRLKPGVAHPLSKARRAQFEKGVAENAKSWGLEVFDEMKGPRTTVGKRFMYDMEDNKSAPSILATPSKAVTMLTDVEYRKNLSSLNSIAMGQPIAMYTIMPNRLAGKTKESTWRIDCNGVFFEYVAGGSTFVHQLWDYSPEQVFLGGKFTTYLYRVCKYPVPGFDHRVAVYLLPRFRLLGPTWLWDKLAWLSGVVPTRGLKRLTPPSVDWNTGIMHAPFMREGPSGPEVFMSFKTTEPTFDSAEITPGSMTRVYQSMLVSKTFTLGNVINICKDSGSPVTENQAALLVRALRATIFVGDPVNYSPSGAQDCPEKAILAAPPMVEPASLPATEPADVVKAAKERNIDKQNKNGEIPADMKKLGRLFVRMLIPDGTTLRPDDLETAEAATLKTAAQIRTYTREKTYPSSSRPKTVEAFGKSEPVEGGAQGSKPPRLVINQTKTNVLNLARFHNPLKRFLSENYSITKGGFWAPGHSAEEIADALSEYHKLAVQEGLRLSKSDYSKMDASVHKFLNLLYTDLYKRAFPQEYHAELDMALKTCFHQKIRVVGAKSPGNTGESVLSGHIDTTTRNEFSNAGLQFIANALAFPNKQAAWWFKMIGLKFGDDGSQISTGKLVHVAESFGMVVKESEQTGSETEFLSRLYPDLRTSGASGRLIERALKRIPVVVPGNKTALQALADKVNGYLISDPDTPCVSSYCRALIRVLKLPAPSEPVNDDYRPAGSYPCMNSEEKQRFLELQVGPNLTLSALQAFDAAIDAASTIEEIEACRLDVDRPPTMM